MRRSAALLVALWLLPGCLAHYRYPDLVRREAPVPAGVVFRDVSVFPATSSAILDHRDVTVRDRHIVSIAETGGELPVGAQIIEGAGKTLLPGFVDFHGHLTGTAAPPWRLTWPDPDHTGRAYLYCGVTTVYDVAGDLKELVALRRREKKGEWIGPRFTYAGQMVTPIGGYPASMVRDLLFWPLSSIAAGHFATEIRTARDAERAVKLRQEKGADHVKVAVAQIPLDAPVFDDVLLKSVVTAAHQRGMKVVAHIDTQEHALLAARAGVDVLVHLVQLGRLSSEAARELAQRHVSVALTLVAFDRMEKIKQGRYAPTAVEHEMNPAEPLDQWSPAVVKAHHVSKGMETWIAALEASHDARMENVRRLQEAGVNIVAGSDCEGSAATWAGGAYLDELNLMVAAGIPPAEVLLAATSRPARLIESDPDYGTIEAGKRADLVLVRGNPLEDMDIALRIEVVMQSGQVLTRSALQSQ